MVDVKEFRKGIEELLAKKTTEFCKGYVLADPKAVGDAEYFRGSFSTEPINDFLELVISSKSDDISFHNRRFDLVKKNAKKMTENPFFIREVYYDQPHTRKQKQAPPTKEEYIAFCMLDIALKYHLGDSFAMAMHEFYPHNSHDSYILGFDKARKPIECRLAEISLDESLPTYDAWKNLSKHIHFFMNLDIKNLRKLVEDFEVWSHVNKLKEQEVKIPNISNGALIGSTLLRFGEQHKAYASRKPHEILLNTDFMRSITLVDCFEDGLLFKLKYPDNQISVGFVSRAIGEVAEQLEDAFLGYFYALSDSSYGSFFGSTTLSDYFGNNLFAFIGAMARDMFICERREAHYHIQTRKPRKGGKKKELKEKVVWLPRSRVVYKHLEDFDESEWEKIVQNIAPTEVDGYTRKCKNPSPKQLELAKRFGVVVPFGETFVRPHHRKGYSKESVKYKSRSAFSLLFTSRERDLE